MISMADDRVLFMASDDVTVRVWRRNFCGNDRLHMLIMFLPAKDSPVKALTLTPDREVLYGGCTDGYIHYWFKGWLMGQLQYRGCLQGHTHAILCMESTENYVISGSTDSTSRDLGKRPARQATTYLPGDLSRASGPVRCVTAYSGQSGDGTEDGGCTICTGSLDGVLKLWRVTSTNPDWSRIAPPTSQ